MERIYILDEKGQYSEAETLDQAIREQVTKERLAKEQELQKENERKQRDNGTVCEDEGKAK